MTLKDLRAPTDGSFRLQRTDPSDTSLFEGSKEQAEAKIEHLRGELGRLQELLYADHRHAVLIVLQGMDSAGKDGVIRHVFDGVNPQGVHVAAFKTPTPEEGEHDFLWRVHAHTPGKGSIAIFNRSHYEDVLVVRVHGLVPRETWEQRYRAINDFERELVHEGTTVLKFFLHIDKDEQKSRLQERLDDPTKRWKFSTSDLRERELWSKYQEAYEEMVQRTSTEWAPWFVVPSNHKWFRNWAISRELIGALEGLKLTYPEAPKELHELHIH